MQTSALPLGYAAVSIWDLGLRISDFKKAVSKYLSEVSKEQAIEATLAVTAWRRFRFFGAGDEGRTRDFDLGKVALYH